MPTAVAERRPDKAFTPHPAIRCTMPDATLARLIMPTTVAERRLDQALRRIRQFSAPDEGAKCRVAWNY
ncbi:hypothetical protein ACVXG9_07280 [Escherichia coli]